MSESPQRHFRSARALDAPVQPLANMTIAQLLAIAAAAGLGIVLWWALGLIPIPATAILWTFVGRVLLSGAVAGVLAVVFYALADDRREPVIRQMLGYAVRRHVYHLRETSHGPYVMAFHGTKRHRDARAALTGLAWAPIDLTTRRRAVLRDRPRRMR